MSAQGWLILILVAILCVALVRRIFRASKGKSCAGCCGGDCHSRSKTP